jgi:hypothetical protein
MNRQWQMPKLSNFFELRGKADEESEKVMEVCSKVLQSRSRSSLMLVYRENSL